MNCIEFLDKHSGFLRAVVILVLVIIIIFLFGIFPKIFLLNKIWSDYKETKDPLRLRKMYKRRLKRHSLVFASSTRDNDSGYKEIKKYFDVEEEIVYIPCDCENFDNVFDQFDVVVYQVHDDEFGLQCPIPDSLYKRISKYCSEQHKFCILVCKPGKLIELQETAAEFNPVYVTTVQFYSKLRETLHILLYLT